MGLESIIQKLSDTTKYVDYYNIGGRFQQRMHSGLMGLWHHYTWRELFIRLALMPGFTLAVGYCAAQTCQNEQCSSWNRAILGGAFGFFAIHIPVIQDTLKRRRQIHEASTEILVEINTNIHSLTAINDIGANAELINFTTKINTLLDFKLPVKQRGDIVINLLAQKKVLSEVKIKIKTFITTLNSIITLEKESSLLVSAMQKSADSLLDEANDTKKELIDKKKDFIKKEQNYWKEFDVEKSLKTAVQYLNNPKNAVIDLRDNEDLPEAARNTELRMTSMH